LQIDHVTRFVVGRDEREIMADARSECDEARVRLPSAAAARSRT
jgi:hypothetical protein